MNFKGTVEPIHAHH